jgi:hypothetical protein
MKTDNRWRVAKSPGPQGFISPDALFIIFAFPFVAALLIFLGYGLGARDFETAGLWLRIIGWLVAACWLLAVIANVRRPKRRHSPKQSDPVQR